MAKADEHAGLSGFISKLLSKASPADIKDMLQDAALTKSFDSEPMGADVLQADEFVKDQFATGQVGVVPTEEEIKTGPVEAATGGNAERQIAHYSPNLVPQHGLAQQGIEIGRMVSSMKSMGKAINRLDMQIKMLSAGLIPLLDKSMQPVVAAPVAKAEDEKKEEKKEDKKDDDMAKSAVARSAAELVAAKELMAKADMADGDGLAGTAKSHRDESAAALTKARTLLSAAQVLGASGEVFDALGKSIEVFAKAKIEPLMQAQYPDSHRTGEGPANDMAKAAADMLVKSKEIEAALEGFAVLKGSLEGLMNTVSGQSRHEGGAPVLSKADPIAFTRNISQRIMEMQDSSGMSDSDAMAAHDILGKMSAAQAGMITQDVVAQRLSGASSVVRSLFSDAA